MLPPDTRHVDYDVIPVIIADGCLYRCSFCRVKSHLKFKERSKNNIIAQVNNLKNFFNNEIRNYNSMFLGQHDALNSSIDLMEFAARYGFDTLGFGNSNLEGSNLFIFGSVGSILRADDNIFKRIDNLPFKTYINVGFESSDQDTLNKLGKSIAKESVEKAFAKITKINRSYEHIEITSNFVLSPDLPDGHLQSFFRLMEKNYDHSFYKGAIYFSPLITAENMGWKGNIKREFFGLKIRIPVPSFLYLIQRL